MRPGGATRSCGAQTEISRDYITSLELFAERWNLPRGDLATIPGRIGEMAAAAEEREIREGMITREKALELIYEENKPRYNSLKWYLEIVGLDFESTIRKINLISKHY